MFEELAEAIEGLVVPRSGEAIATLLRLRDRLDAEVAMAVGAFEAAGLHGVDGAVTMASWLAAHAGRDRASAQRTVNAGRKLQAFPVLAAAVLDGSITGGQLDIVLAHVPARHAATWAEHEAEVVPLLVGADVDVTRRAMEAWRARADALDAGPEPVEHDNQVHLARTIDGRRELRASVDADLGALLEAGLRVADPGEHDLPLPVRRAEALRQILHSFLGFQDVAPGGRHVPHLNVVVDLADVHTSAGARYVDSDAPVSAAAYAALRCDATLRRVVVDECGAILDHGRSTREWSPSLYNAIVLRDRGCRFPGCDAPTHWCDVHHVHAWEDGGHTSLDNGALLCRRHHTRIHAPGWHAKLLPDGTVEVTTTDGRVLTSHPRGPRQPALFRPPAGS